MNIAEIIEFVNALQEHKGNARYPALQEESAHRLARAWDNVGGVLADRAQVDELVDRPDILKAVASLYRFESLDLDDDESWAMGPVIRKRRRALADAIVAACFPPVAAVEALAVKEAV